MARKSFDGGYTSFNTQPPEGGWSTSFVSPVLIRLFQHTAARRRLELKAIKARNQSLFQHTAARRRLDGKRFYNSFYKRCFNTQPPEGGWESIALSLVTIGMFQHTAARRRLAVNARIAQVFGRVSTHSRPKAAGFRKPYFPTSPSGFNTQPPEGGWLIANPNTAPSTCFNTQPPEGGWLVFTSGLDASSGFNTQPPEGGWSLSQKPCSIRFRSPNFAKLPRKAEMRV